MHNVFWGRRQYVSIIPINKAFFVLRKDSEYSTENNGEPFHLVVETLLFIMKRSRPNF